MSAKGEVGMRIDLDKVPTRQKNMKAWELLLSESQERMLLVAEKGREKEVQKVFDKWDLPCSVIGEVTDDGILNFYMHGELEASLPAHDLVLGGGAPQYDREFTEPDYFKEIQSFDPGSIEIPVDLKLIAEQLIAVPNIASKRWIYRQYDSMVGAGNASTNEPSDAAIVIAKPTGKGLALTTDCNSRYVFADPYKGGMIAVAEAARNIVCSGGQPLGITNCLNFGNPYDPEVYYQFVHALKGMGEACIKFDTPVTGGNVSFYNQGPEGAVYPTPTIGMVGLLDSVTEKMTLDFKDEGDIIFLVGSCSNDINSSEYLHKIRGVEYSPAPEFDLEKEFVLQQKITELIRQKIIKSAHDVSEGGLFITLVESCFNRNRGIDVVAADFNIRKDAYWFGEGQSRVVVTIADTMLTAFKKIMGDQVYNELGTVTDGSIEVDGMYWGTITEWKDRYDNAIGNMLDSTSAENAVSVI